MKTEVDNEDQHIDRRKLIDYYQVISELFLMLIYEEKNRSFFLKKIQFYLQFTAKSINTKPSSTPFISLFT
jgi:hypothetical protein